MEAILSLRELRRGGGFTGEARVELIIRLARLSIDEGRDLYLDEMQPPPGPKPASGAQTSGVVPAPATRAQACVRGADLGGGDRLQRPSLRLARRPRGW